MSKTLLEIQTLLEEKIPRSAVAQRDGGGRSLSYLPGHYVIARLNGIFGPFGWATDVKALDLLHQGAIEKYGKTVHTVHYKALVRLVVQGPDGIATEHTDVGYGDGSDKENVGKAHELAMKEAITDAIKRCAKNLGGSMGLYLYDKDQPNVEDDATAGKPAPAASERAGYSAPVASSNGAGTGTVSARPSAVGQHDSRPQGAPVSRDALNKRILSLAKIKASKTGLTLDDVRAEMRGLYGVDKSDQLTDVQAQEFASSLEKAVS